MPARGTQMTYCTPATRRSTTLSASTPAETWRLHARRATARVASSPATLRSWSGTRSGCPGRGDVGPARALLARASESHPPAGVRPPLRRVRGAARARRSGPAPDRAVARARPSTIGCAGCQARTHRSGAGLEEVGAASAGRDDGWRGGGGRPADHRHYSVVGATPEERARDQRVRATRDRARDRREPPS